MEYYSKYIRAGVKMLFFDSEIGDTCTCPYLSLSFFCNLSIGPKNVCVAVSLFVHSVFQNLWNAMRGVKAQLMKEIYNHNASQYLPMVIAGKCFVFILQEYI